MQVLRTFRGARASMFPWGRSNPFTSQSFSVSSVQRLRHANLRTPLRRAARPLHQTAPRLNRPPQFATVLLRLAPHLARGVLKLWSSGAIRTKHALIILGVTGGGVALFIFEYGEERTLAVLNGQTFLDDPENPLTEQERDEALASLAEVESELRRLGPIEVMAGTSPPAYWTSEQAKAQPTEEFACVKLTEGTDEAVLRSLRESLHGHDIGVGGRDAVGGTQYSALQLVDAWRIENRTMWGKFAAERQQTLASMQSIKDARLRLRVANPHIRRGLLDATRTLRKHGGCDTKINEFYLFHGLGDPAKVLNIAASGMNEHFSGVNAGTMFGDGIYLAEDMGKSDQYCRTLTATSVLGGQTSDERALRKALGLSEKDNLRDVRFAFLARTVLGVYVSVGQDRTKQLHANAPVFAAGTRELALVPGMATPTHFHSEIAEVAPSSGVASDTHTERGGNPLRFREMIVFRPTLVYPEYVIAYRRR